MIKAIVFDCFGVLATEAWLPFKTEHFGHDAALYEQVTQLSQQANGGAISYQEFIRSVASLAGVGPDAIHDAISKNVPNQTLFNYLINLKKNYKLGFLSNVASDRLGDIFSEEQLGLFDAIVLSYQHGFYKPQPEAYQTTAEQLGVGVSECVFVDDQERQVAGARQAGGQAVLYKDFDQFKTELEKLLTRSGT